jgi:bacteriocin biosynthesis cyclodehydratase domain-containing protein
MPNPRIRRYYSIIGHSPDCVELRHGVWNPVSFTLTDQTNSGQLFTLLASLDGTLSPAELARQQGMRRSDVEAVLDHLRELDVLEEGTARSTLDYYLNTAIPGLANGNDPDTQGSSSVLLMGDTDVTNSLYGYLQNSLPEGRTVSLVLDNNPLRSIVFDSDSAWLMNGIEFYERMQLFEAWRGQFIVAATKVINPIAFRTLNRVCLHLRIPWLHATLDGPFLFVGPLFIPYRSSCYECFETRVAMNLRENASYQRYKNAMLEGRIRLGSLPVEPALVGTLAGHTAMETINYIFTGSGFTAQKVLAIYLPTMEITFNEVLRVPGCPACGAQSERDDKELYFDVQTLVQHS